MLLVLKNFYKNHQFDFLVLAALFMVTCLTYSNSLHNNFMIDDYGLFLQDTKKHNPDFLFYHFIPDTEKFLQIENLTADADYRPLSHLLPMIEYLFFRMNPFGYHIVNLFLFFGVCVFIYIFLGAICADKSVAFLTSMLFCVHPINGLFVNYITANVFSFQILALIGSLLLCMKAFKKKRGAIYYYGGSLVCYVVALLCHETSVAMPFYLTCLLYIGKHVDFKKVALRVSPFLFITILYLLFRINNASLKVGILDKMSYFDITFLTYIASLTKIIFWYLTKLVTLKGIVLIWGTPVVKENSALWNSLFVLFASCSTYLVCRWKRDIKSFALVWFMIGFIPISLACFFNPQIGFMIEPHWLFFSSIGLFLLAAIVLLNLRKNAHKKIVFILIGTIITSFIFSSREYNRLWGDEKRYCQYWLREVPGFKNVMFYLANQYMEEKDFDNAIFWFTKAINNQKTDWQIYNNLGLIKCAQGHIEQAQEYYQNALTVNPQSSVVYNNLGLSQSENSLLEEAEQSFLKAIQLNPYLLEPRLNLGRVYEQQDKKQRAITLYKENLRINPNDERSLFALTMFHLTSGMIDEAANTGQLVLQWSTDQEHLMTLGGMFANHNIPRLAREFYTKALQIDPNNASVYLELGKLYGNAQLFEQAIAIWQEGLSLTPKDGRFGPLIEKAKALQATANH